MNKKITLFNQVTGPLFIDMANVYAEKYEEVILVTGAIISSHVELDKKITIVYQTKYKRNKGYLRIITWLLFFIQSYFYLLKNKNTGKIVFVTNPPIVPFLGSIFSSRKDFEYEVLVYDIYPEALTNFGYLNKSSILYKYWNWMNKKTYTKANRIFTICEVMKKVISKNAPANKIKVVYPWVDTSFIKPMKKDHNWFVKKYKLVNKNVILYSGNMGITHDLMSVLRVAEELNKSVNDYHFLFIGDGAQKKALIKYQIENKLTNMTFLPYQDAEVLPYSFAAADFGIVTLGSGAEGLSVPSKTFYLLAAGNAIISISEKGSEIEKLIVENNCGLSVEPGNVKGIINFLTNTSKIKLNEYKQRSRILSESFTVKNAAEFE